jgi:RNA ligase (TIGR02306 family)
MEGSAWQVVVQKGLHEIGNLVVYIEVDSILPDKPWCEFMKPRGLRVRTIEFKQTVSQGLIIPLSDIKDEWNDSIADLTIGLEVSELLNCTHYEKPIPACLSGVAKGGFPISLFPKSDEENIQNIPQIIKYCRDNSILMYSTKKYDGSPLTAYRENQELNVCSRNLNIKRPADLNENSFWRMAGKYSLGDLPEGWAIQAELIGPGVQKNVEGLKELEIRVFAVHNFAEGRNFVPYAEMIRFCREFALPMAEALDISFFFDPTASVESLLEDVEKVAYQNGRQVEGVVYRPVLSDRKREHDLKPISFKVVSNKYRLKHGE